MEHLHVMDKRFTFDNRLKLNDVPAYAGVIQLLNFTPVGCIGWRNLNILQKNVKMLNFSEMAKGVDGLFINSWLL